MFVDKKILAVVECCSKNNIRPAMKNVRIEGNKITATDGHILAQYENNSEANPDDTSAPEVDGEGVVSGDEPFNMSGENLAKAFSRLPKKSSLPVMQGVYIKKGVMANVAPLSDRFVVKEDIDQAYPLYVNCIPDKSPTDTVVAISKETLETILAMMKKAGYKGFNSGGVITFRILQQSSKGFVANPVLYHMGTDSDHITGMISPCRVKDDKLCNYDNPNILMDDVSKMMNLLRELRPDDEQVRTWDMKYPGLVTKPEESEESKGELVGANEKAGE